MSTKTPPAPKLARWNIDDLKANEANPRKISKSRFEDLKRSLKADPTFLEVRPIIVNVSPTRRGIIIGGHMRFLAAKELGWKDVPVIEVHATVAEERAWMLKDNAHHGEWDRQAMADMVLPDTAAFEHALPSDQLDDLVDEFAGDQGDAGTEEEQADAVAAATEHITKPGDVWDLGDHRLVCGDSTAPETFAALLEGGKEAAQMTFTDPPYNVDYGNHDNPRWGKKHDKIANDKMTDEAWAGFVRAFLANIKKHTAGAVYVCMSCKEWPSLHKAFIEAGFHWSTTVLWIKDVFTLGRSDYQRQHEPMMVGKTMKSAKAEPILYGWPAGIDRKWNGGRDEGDAWFIKRPRTNPIHPTQKPVELVARAVANSSSRGDIVLDCFAGGGSTLIACERTNRRARLVELDAGYCDAIIARYVGHTKNAKLKRNGEEVQWTGPVITIEGVLDSLG